MKPAAPARNQNATAATLRNCFDVVGLHPAGPAATGLHPAGPTVVALLFVEPTVRVLHPEEIPVERLLFVRGSCREGASCAHPAHFAAAARLPDLTALSYTFRPIMNYP